MTIQELLEKYENMLEDCEEKALPGFVDLEVLVADLRQFLNTLRPTVSQEVSDWYERPKEIREQFLTDTDTFNDLGWKLPKGMTIQKAVNMYQFGYKIETSPLYRVIIPNVKKSRSCLVYNLGEQKWYFKARNTKDGAYRINHTREQLEEAGFGWVFDCGFAQEDEE